MNKDLNQKLHRKSQRKRYKNLSLEYKTLIKETVPDLWERIEAGIEISDSGENQIEAGNCLQGEELQIFLNNRAGSLADTSSKINDNIIRRTAVAACICMVAAVPLLFSIVSNISRGGGKSAKSGSGADYMADGAADYNMADYDMADNVIADYDMADNAVSDYEIADNAIVDNGVMDNALKDSAITNNDAAGNMIADNQQDFLKSDNTQERNAASAGDSIVSEDAYDTDHTAIAGSNAEQTEQEITDNADLDTFASIIVTATVLEAVLQDNGMLYTIQIDALSEQGKLEADVLDVPDSSDAEGLEVPDKSDVSETPNISENSILMKQLEIGSQIQVYSQSDTAIKLTIGRQYNLKLLIQKVEGNVIYLME